MIRQACMDYLLDNLKDHEKQFQTYRLYGAGRSNEWLMRFMFDGICDKQGYDYYAILGYDYKQSGLTVEEFYDTDDWELICDCCREVIRTNIYPRYVMWLLVTDKPEPRMNSDGHIV